MSYFIYKGSKSVVESLDLFFLLNSDGLDVRVNLYVQRSQETLVDSHCGQWRGHDGTLTHTYSMHTIQTSTIHSWVYERPFDHPNPTPGASIEVLHIVTLDVKPWVNGEAAAIGVIGWCPEHLLHGGPMGGCEWRSTEWRWRWSMSHTSLTFIGDGEQNKARWFIGYKGGGECHTLTSSEII